MRTLILLFLIIAGFQNPIFSQREFIHPGGLHTLDDLDRMRENVAAGEQPWLEGWKELLQDAKAQHTYKARPLENMGDNRQLASKDAHAAYLNAIRWYVSEDEAHARCAIDILNDWASTINQVPSGNEIVGLGGIAISEFALAAEIMRISDLWRKADFERFKHVMETYLYPVCHDFLENHEGRNVDYFWANWDACNIAALLAIGVLCDNEDIYNEGVLYFKHGLGNGSIKNAIPYLHPNGTDIGLGQWQESGRDQEHAQLGVGLLGNVCQIAWNQGDDLYGYDNNRLLAGAEYVAKYNLMQHVPFNYYNNSQGLNNRWPAINGRGQLKDRPLWEMIYNHYEEIKGIPAPNSKRMAELMRPEHGSKDHFGYGTLTFTQQPSAFPPLPVPETPERLTATASVGNVFLEWDPSEGIRANGYSIKRAGTENGEFREIASYTDNTINRFTDYEAENGQEYFYRVAAMNQAGMSDYSDAAEAMPVNAGQLPEEWELVSVGENHGGSATYADVAEGTFIVEGRGRSIGGDADDVTYACTRVNGNQVITGRINDISGSLIKTGLMMRESRDADAKTVTMTRGDAGWRFARMGSRRNTGDNMSFAIGNTYTWLPAWFRLKRVGDVFYAFESPDGINWYYVDSVDIEMSENYYVGLFVCPGSETEKTKTVFDYISVSDSWD